MKRRLICGILILAFIVAAAGCAEVVSTPTPTATPTPTPTATPTPTPTLTPGKVFEWVFAEGATWASIPYDLPFLEAFEEACEGRIKITKLQYGEHPYKFADLWGALRDGNIDMTRQMPWVTSSTEPLGALLELPMILVGGGLEEFNAIMEDPRFADVRNVVYESVCEKYNSVPLNLCNYPDYGFATMNTLLKDMDSLKGLKIRVNSPEVGEMLIALGATPVTMPPGEIDPALQRGILDGWCTGAQSRYFSKGFEMTKYFTRCQYLSGMSIFALNKDRFDELPADLQDRVMEVSAEWEEIMQEEWLTKAAYVAAVGAMDENGVTMCSVSPALKEELREAMRPVWAQWAERAGPGAAELVQRVDQFHSEWIKAQE